MSEVKKIKEEELKLIIEQQKNLNNLLVQTGVLDFQKSKIIEDNSYNIYITKNDEVLPWKKFNSNMAVSVEYDLKY